MRHRKLDPLNYNRCTHTEYFVRNIVECIIITILYTLLSVLCTLLCVLLAKVSIMKHNRVCPLPECAQREKQQLQMYAVCVSGTFTTAKMEWDQYLTLIQTSKSVSGSGSNTNATSPSSLKGSRSFTSKDSCVFKLLVRACRKCILSLWKEQHNYLKTLKITK